MTLLFLFLTCSAACAVGVFTMALIASGKIADLRAWNAALSADLDRWVGHGRKQRQAKYEAERIANIAMREGLEECERLRTSMADLTYRLERIQDASMADLTSRLEWIQDAAFRQGMRVAAAFVESKSGRGHSLANVAEWVRKKAAKPSLKRPAA